ncbi:hypothetical protein C8Q72DRAFT_925596 [Fomitopsis betulina]|nr:hypothetical protein C8Q72DRAFT_925596 [Fomitopsis betulina]
MLYSFLSFSNMAPFLYLCMLSVLASSVAALNDWTKACLAGECSYDLAASSLHISGSPTAISDLTSAAGWQILDCDANSTAQDIRAVCADHNASCDHLFQGGAVGTIVRLPENCTTMPFARVAKVWDHENQTRDIRRLGRFYITGASTNVKGISLDTNFSAVDVSQFGNVTFAIQASGSPGASARNKRDLVADNITNFNHTLSADPVTITFDNQTILLDTSSPTISVDSHFSVSGDLKVAVTPHVDLTVQVGIGAAGTLVPPELTELGLITNLNGQLDGTLNLNTTAMSTFSTGSIPLFQVGIPGLDIPGILSVGPTFQINAKATAVIPVAVSLDTDFEFNAENLELYFPPTSSSYSGDISNGKNTATITPIGPQNVTVSNSTLTLDLIPGISFGVSSLDGIADASINLNLGNFVQLGLSLDNQGVSSASTNSTSNRTVEGSVDIVGGFNIVASADASLFGLFNASKSITLFSKKFDLFQHNF